MSSGRSSPPPGPKPKSAIPSHIVNGGSPLGVSTGARDARERDVLNSSIRSSFSSRKPVQIEPAGPEEQPHAESSSASGTVPAVPNTGTAKLVAPAIWR
jgi:GTP cyclohydrolase I